MRSCCSVGMVVAGVVVVVVVASEFGCDKMGSAPIPVWRIVSITRYNCCLSASISA